MMRKQEIEKIIKDGFEKCNCNTNAICEIGITAHVRVESGSIFYYTIKRGYPSHDDIMKYYSDGQNIDDRRLTAVLAECDKMIIDFYEDISKSNPLVKVFDGNGYNRKLVNINDIKEVSWYVKPYHENEYKLTDSGSSK